MTSSTKNIIKSLKNVLLKKSVLSVFILVALWSFITGSSWLSEELSGEGAVKETLREVRDLNVHLQLRFYQLLVYFKPISLNTSNVRLVYIDNETHWTDLHGAEPTSRRFLAQLITNASQPPGQAQAIGLDVELLAPQFSKDGEHYAALKADDLVLLKAIIGAANRGVPVVIASVYREDRGRQVAPLPNIYTQSDLSQGLEPMVNCGEARCPAFGFINLPPDKREIPLQREVAEHSKQSKLVDSFALALAKAVRGPDQMQRRLGRKELLDAETFGTFVPESNYNPVSALSLLNSNASELKGCAGKVLLIGGHWNELEGYGSLVDQHLSPTGTMSGVGLHANYLSSLLQDQFSRTPPVWLDILIDLFVGLLIYTSVELGKGAGKSLSSLAVAGTLVLAAVIPICCAYASLTMFNLYLDFVLPVELYFLHLIYELAEDYLHRKLKGAVHSA